MSTNYNYDIAVSVLSEADKNRILCCFLNATDTNAVNWDKASKDFKSASIESFRKMVNNALKKVRGAEADGDGGDGATGTPGEKAKGSGKKRKGAAQGDGESPTKKGKGGKKGASAAGDGGGDEGGMGVKPEVKGEDDAEF